MPQGKPFLKWVGGKRELLPDLLPYVPYNVKNYYEPFLGGGALFWALGSLERYQTAYVSDLNADLINLYRIIRDCPVQFMEAMSVVAETYRQAGAPSDTVLNPEAGARDFYNMMRASNPPTALDSAVRFLFLNKTCFNGLHRTNKKGVFNSPWGKELNVNFFDPANILDCSAILRAVGVRHQGFSAVSSEAVPGDFVYFDPPYIPVSKTADFASYTADGFTLDDQKFLANLFRKLSDSGVGVMLSNSDAPEIRELYDGFEIKIIRARRSVNSKADARGPVNEVLVLGKGVTAAVMPFDLMAQLDQEYG